MVKDIYPNRRSYLTSEVGGHDGSIISVVQPWRLGINMSLGVKFIWGWFYLRTLNTALEAI